MDSKLDPVNYIVQSVCNAQYAAKFAVVQQLVAEAVGNWVRQAASVCRLPARLLATIWFNCSITAKASAT